MSKSTQKKATASLTSGSGPILERHASSVPGTLIWAVMVEVGQRIDQMETTAEVVLRGTSASFGKIRSIPCVSPS